MNIARGGIFRYWPSLRSPAKLIEVATTSWLHIENWRFGQIGSYNTYVVNTYIEVRDGFSRVDSTSDHLHELIRRDTVTQAGEEKVGEGSDESTEDKCDDVGPPRKRGLALEHYDQT